MNLQENIHRIKEMMGFVNDNVPPQIRRRMDLLDKLIKSSYEWLLPSRFNNFDEFLDRVVFSTVRDFSNELGLEDYEEIIKVRDESEEFIKNIIIDNYIDEIKEYFDKNRFKK
jgi:hypothetical protein